jgi:hypothetical protein
VKGAARLSGPALRIGAILLALLFTTAILLIAGAPPLEAYRQIALGSVGSIKKVTDVMVAWVPLVLATSGLLLTFAAGLWNIGIEGQITLGAIFATGVLRLTLDGSLPPVLAITAALAAGIVGGAIWALLAGLLKAYGGVNEIFGGLGLNFVAVALNVWLIFGPWGRPGVASMSGTEPFPDSLALPALGGLRLSPWAVVLWPDCPGLLSCKAPTSAFAQGGRQEPAGGLPVGDTDGALHVAGLRAVRRPGWRRRGGSGDGRLPSVDPGDFERLRLPGTDGGHARQLPADVDAGGGLLLCRAQHRLDPAPNRAQA